MPIDLPQLPRKATVDPKLRRFGGDLTPVLGGPVTRLTRLGARFAIEVGLPQMDKVCAAEWISARARAEAEGETLRLVLPQLGDGAAAGAPVVTSGAVNSATVTKAGGGLVTEGMLFSFAAGGRTYLHLVTSVLGGTLGVAPLLRASPVGQALNFASPTVEGLVDEVAWSMSGMRFVGQRFTIAEDR